MSSRVRRSSRGRRRRAPWGDGWVFTLEEPLLAPRASGESGGDVLAHFAQALRGVRARESSVSLVMCDTLDLLGGSVFVLD